MSYSPGVPCTRIITSSAAKAQQNEQRLAEIAKSEGKQIDEFLAEVKRGRGRPRKVTNEQPES